MYQQDVLYALFLLLSAFVAAVTISFILPRRSTIGSLPLLIMMAAIFEWTLT